MHQYTTFILIYIADVSKQLLLLSSERLSTRCHQVPRWTVSTVI